MSRISEWNAQNYKRYITDTSSPQRIGHSGLYCLQNGLLLKRDIHMVWDSWGIAIDPDVNPSEHSVLHRELSRANAYTGGL